MILRQYIVKFLKQIIDNICYFCVCVILPCFCRLRTVTYMYMYIHRMEIVVHNPSVRRLFVYSLVIE